VKLFTYSNELMLFVSIYLLL